MSNIVPLALRALAQVRYMHWMTTNYIVHKELGTLYEQLDPLVDRLVESYLGTTATTTNLTSLSLALEGVYENETYIDKLLGIKQKFKLVRENLDSALQNIIDEITGAIDQSLYLIKLT